MSPGDELIERLYNAGIKNPLEFVKSKRNHFFDWLNGAFPREILPTDIDGFVEVGGYYMVLEFKHEDTLRTGRIPLGQRYAFEGLIETGKFNILFIGHDNNQEITCYQLWRRNGTKDPVVDGDRCAVFRLCNQWSDFADQGARK